MFQQRQGESLYEAWTRFKDLLQKVPHHGIDLWLQVQIFNDHIDQTLKRTVDYAIEGRLRKMSAKKSWTTIEELARYEDEGWNNPVFLGEKILEYKNPNMEQLLGMMECKVEMLMKNAISLIGRSEDVYRITKEKVQQLEEYMSVNGNDFMKLSLEVITKLKEEIRVEENRVKNIKKITRYPDTEDLEPLSDCKFSETLTKKAFSDTSKFIPTMSKHTRQGKSTMGQSFSSRECIIKEKVREFGAFDNDTHRGYFDTISRCSIHSGIIID
ncbi:hypothetical protein Tco_0199220 [Tanacetum coccineum]